jgi:5-methylcytosine-specific restriction protein A
MRSCTASPTPRLRGRAAVKQRKLRLTRTYGLCEDCDANGRIQAAAVVDHVIPLAHGGSDEDTNTRNLCKPCHKARTAEQFGHKKRRQIAVDGWPVAD